MLQEKLDFVIPVFNEEECLPELIGRLEVIRNNTKNLELSYIFVNDGSSDNSLNILSEYASENPYVRVISFSRNFGHQIAVSAGLDFAKADYICIIDADLQDPPELVSDMLRTLKEKHVNVVYGQREERKGESLFKKATAKLFYRIFKYMSGINIPLDTGDFRLIDKKVRDAFSTMKERHRFIRGMIPWTGFKSAPFLYIRDVRYAGVTKYPLRKMLKFSADAILSFSSGMLKVAAYVGIFIVIFGGFGLLYILYLKLFTHTTVPGITVILATIFILGGFTIFMLGIIGAYVGRIYEEAKGRPLYIIDNMMNMSDET
jgi:glycosyltransferase involved in cell wall biosynthesis